MNYLLIDAKALSSYGGGDGSFLLDNVQCSGSENHLLDCMHRGVGIHNCVASEAAGVNCSSGTNGNIYSCIITNKRDYYYYWGELVSRARRIYYVFITLGGARGRENTSGVSRGLSMNIRNSITA